VLDQPRKRIARLIPDQNHTWEVSQKLREVVTRTGFAINAQKTRMQYRTSRQDVTGLVVNSKVNIRSEYRRTVRAMAHRLFMTGRFERIETVPVPDANGVLAPTKKEGTLVQLHGMFGHIDRVDLHNANRVPPTEEKRGKETSGIGSKESLYRRFLMFKEFYVASVPVIIGEGKTDSVYLRQAIKALAPNYPTLATISAQGKAKLSVRLFKYPKTSTTRILQLRGGFGDLNEFINDYRREGAKFKAPGNHQPVILLVDNDDAAKRIFSSVYQITKIRPTGKEPFIRITGNLYLVVVPPKEGQNKTVIEDAFSETTRQTNIGGKSLSLHDDYDTETHYGKVSFSRHVEEHASKIDFGGFTEILNRPAAVIKAHREASEQHN
jgi:RNA-directed DNA polymerase